MDVVKQRESWFNSTDKAYEADVEGVPSEYVPYIARKLAENGKAVTHKNIKTAFDVMSR